MKTRKGVSKGIFLLVLFGFVRVAKAEEPPVFSRVGNLADASASWEYSPGEVWSMSVTNDLAQISVRADRKFKERSAWFAATLPLQKSNASSLRFGGWVRLAPGDEYGRSHYAAIRLISGKGEILKEARSFSCDGTWAYVEERLEVPDYAGNLSLQLAARPRSSELNECRFTGLFVVPDDQSPPEWQDELVFDEEISEWRCPEHNYRIFGAAAEGSDNQPLWADFDFSRLLLKAGTRVPLDPASLKVLAVSDDGGAVEVTAAFDHPLGSLADRYVRNGTLKWRTVAGAQRYEIYFNTAGPEGPKPLVSGSSLGLGEVLLYAENEQGLLWAGWPGQDLDVRDVDGDGDWDIYAKNTDADIWLMRNIGSNEAPLFLPRQKPLPGDQLPQMPMGDIRIDWNGDGADDAIVFRRKTLGAGRYIDGMSVSVHARLTGNGGSLGDLVNLVDGAGRPVVLTNATWYHVVSGDFDGDGAPDLVAGSSDSDLQIWLNRGVVGGKPTVEIVRIPFNRFDDPYDSGDMSLKPCAVDWNGDGRDDIVFTGWSGFVRLLINKNLPKQAEFEEAMYLREVNGAVYPIETPTPEVVDWDGDGDLDLLCGNINGYLFFIENKGSPGNPQLAPPVPLKDENGRIFRITAAEEGGTIQGPAERWWGYTSVIAFDVDGDGDLDLIINDSLGRVRWIENIGTRTAPVLSGDIRTFMSSGQPLMTPWRNSPTVADWNNDGVPELTVLGHDGRLIAYELNAQDPDRLGAYRFFKDEAGRDIVINEHPISQPNGGRSHLDAGDWDGDGKIDLLVGRPRNTTGGGNLVFYENIGTAENPVLKKGMFMARGGRFAEWTKNGCDAHETSAGCMADWNGDGKMDLVFGMEMGRLSFYSHDYFEGSTFPVLQAERFQKKETDGIRTVHRFGVAGSFEQMLEPPKGPIQWLAEDIDFAQSGNLQSAFAVHIASPPADEVISGDVVFEAVGTGRQLSKIEFFVDGEYLDTEAAAPYVAFGDNSTWNTRTVENGEHVLSVTATYFDGRTRSASQTNRVENK
jgi:hypothetical protein